MCLVDLHVPTSHRGPELNSRPPVTGGYTGHVHCSTVTYATVPQGQAGWSIMNDTLFYVSLHFSSQLCGCIAISFVRFGFHFFFVKPIVRSLQNFHTWRVKWFRFLHCCVDLLIFTDRAAQSAAMPVLFLLSSPKIGSRCPDKRESWYGTADWISAPPCQISHSLGQKCGNTAPKLSKFQILAINLPLSLQNFYEILRFYTRL